MKNKSGHKPICSMQMVREERQSEVIIMSIKKSPYSWFRKQRKRKSEKHTGKTPPDPSSHIMLAFTSATNNLPALFQEQAPLFHHAYKRKTNPLDVWGNNNWYQEQPDNIPKLQISVWHDSWYENPWFFIQKIHDFLIWKSTIPDMKNPFFCKKPFATPSDGLPNFVFSLITRIEHHPWKKKVRFRV